MTLSTAAVGGQSFDAQGIMEEADSMYADQRKVCSAVSKR